MVLDCCVTIASTIISMMMNGICCVYQQNEEQKLREAIRQDIRSEYYSMYHQQQSNEQQAVVTEKPIPSSSIRTDLSIDGEESVFIISSLHIQEDRRVKLMKQKGQMSGAINTSQVSMNDPNRSTISDGGSAACYNHDEMRSPFITLTNQNNSRRNKSDMEEDDVDEGMQRIISTSTSWTTISIV